MLLNMKMDVEVNSTTTNGYTPLYLASANKATKAYKLIQEAGACARVCACMCFSLCVYVFQFVYVCSNMATKACKLMQDAGVCVRTCVRVCVSVCVCARVHVYAHMHSRTSVPGFPSSPPPPPQPPPSTRWQGNYREAPQWVSKYPGYQHHSRLSTASQPSSR